MAAMMVVGAGYVVETTTMMVVGNGDGIGTSNIGEVMMMAEGVAKVAIGLAADVEVMT